MFIFWFQRSKPGSSEWTVQQYNMLAVAAWSPAAILTHIWWGATRLFIHNAASTTGCCSLLIHNVDTSIFNFFTFQFHWASHWKMSSSFVLFIFVFCFFILFSVKIPALNQWRLSDFDLFYLMWTSQIHTNTVASGHIRCFALKILAYVAIFDTKSR